MTSTCSFCWGQLLRVVAQYDVFWCTECGLLTDGDTKYLPLLTEHRKMIADDACCIIADQRNPDGLSIPVHHPFCEGH